MGINPHNAPKACRRLLSCSIDLQRWLYDRCAGCAAHYQCCGTSGRKAARLEGFAARTVLICNGRRGGSGVHRRDRTAKGWSLARPVSRSGPSRKGTRVRNMPPGAARFFAGRLPPLRPCSPRPTTVIACSTLRNRAALRIRAQCRRSGRVGGHGHSAASRAEGSLWAHRGTERGWRGWHDGGRCRRCRRSAG